MTGDGSDGVRRVYPATRRSGEFISPSGGVRRHRRQTNPRRSALDLHPASEKVNVAQASKRPRLSALRGQDAHAPPVVKMNLHEFPAGRKLAVVSHGFGRHNAGLRYGSQFWGISPNFG
jgi:hypothetical protein